MSHTKRTAKIHQKVPQMHLPNPTWQHAPFYPCWKDFWPPKNVKTPPELKDWGEGLRQGSAMQQGLAEWLGRSILGPLVNVWCFLGAKTMYISYNAFCHFCIKKIATCWKLRKYQGVFARRCPKTTAKSVAFVTSGKTVNTMLFGFQSAKNFRILVFFLALRVFKKKTWKHLSFGIFPESACEGFFVKNPPLY